MRKKIKNLLARILWSMVVPLIRDKRIIAITGSAGKSTTKFLVGSVLHFAFGKRVLVGYGNLGTILGIPLALLGIKNNDLPASAWLYLLPLALAKSLAFRLFGYPYDIIVTEVAADLPGQINWIGARLKPHIVIVTSLGASHLEFFSDISGVEKEKGSLVRHLQRGGVLILPRAQIKMKRYLTHRRASIKTLTQKGESFGTSAATLVGKHFGISSQKIKRGLRQAPKLPGRLKKIISRHGFVVLDSSYNANPVSMRVALEALLKEGAKNGKGQRIAVLGTMAELGKKSSFFHKQIGREFRKVAQTIISVGTDAREYKADYHFSSYRGVGEKILSIARRGDTILVKGSHSVHLEKVVAKII